ncbi:hypothetical protein BG004_002244 [Podila humilis]|nr:hypothetical protein BG004_002244 [Podila humilis]
MADMQQSPILNKDNDLTVEALLAQAQQQLPATDSIITANDIRSTSLAASIDTGLPAVDVSDQSHAVDANIADSPATNTTSFTSGLASDSTSASSFYDSLDMDPSSPVAPIQALDKETVSISTPPLSIMKQQLSASSSSSSLLSPTEKPSPTSTSPLNTSKFGSKKVRTGAGSNISKRINMFAQGLNENGSDLHTRTASNEFIDPSGATPNPSEYPDSFFEDLLREDQAPIQRSLTTMPKPTPRRTTPSASSSMPLQTSKFGTSTADSNNDNDTLVLSGDLEEDLKRLQTELAKTKEVKFKAEADAKAQRVTVMSLKTEVQLVRNVLKRRETELGDAKDMSNAYESDLTELRRKLEVSERQLSKGQGEMEAKIRALERLRYVPFTSYLTLISDDRCSERLSWYARDESVARIQTLDQDIKKLREQVKTLQKKNEDVETEMLGLRSELEELEPFRQAAIEQRTLTAEEPIKVKELNTQITELEDTRVIQAALIEELETKITTVEAEALEFKGKAELEYEALSDGFKVLKTRRSEEIRVLKAELEQHKLQEQIIEKLQSDIDGLQSALALVANSQSTENARINQVTAELNEALALKDQEVVQVRQNMTEFEESHNRLVSSLQATLATINEEADSARKSRDEAVSALESLRQELEALRHSLPINNKHMSLSAWSAEQQQLQQDQLKVIEELEGKLEGRVEGVKEDQQRAQVLGANTKRKSQQLALDLEHHLQLSNAIVKSSVADSEQSVKDDSSSDVTTMIVSDSKSDDTSSEAGTISVRTMLNFLTQLQGRSMDFEAKNAHVREGTDATVAAWNNEDYETQLRAYLTRMDDTTLLEPWAKEKQMETEIDRLEQKIKTLLSDLSTANQEKSVAQDSLKHAQLKHEASLAEEREQRDHLEKLEREEREDEERRANDERVARQTELEVKEQELLAKAEVLQSKEQVLVNKEKDLMAKEAQQAKEDEERRKRNDLLPITPPFSAPMTPFGSPNNSDLLPGLMASHRRIDLPGDGSDDESGSIQASEQERRPQDETERQQQAEIAAQQIKLIKSLEEKVAELEKRALQSTLDDHAFPSPPMSRHSLAGSGTMKSNTQSLRSSLLSNPPDIPPPTIALPPVPSGLEMGELNSSKSSLAVSEDGAEPSSSSPRRTKKSSMAHSVSSESLDQKTSAAATEAAIAAAVAAAMAKSEESHKAMAEKLAQSEAELAKSKSEAKDMEVELTTVLTANKESQEREGEVQRLKNENRELAQAMEDIRKSLDVAMSQSKGFEQLKAQLEMQVQKERQAKDEALRAKDHLQSALEEERQKKKGFLCF